MDYSRYTDEELRKVMITNGALTGPVIEECAKRFLEQDPRGYLDGHVDGYEDGYTDGYDAGYEAKE